MTKDELRAAAERILEIAEPRLKHDYMTTEEIVLAVGLACAYLAEHPADDDEPLDVATVESAGLRNTKLPNGDEDDVFVFISEDNTQAIEWGRNSGQLSFAAAITNATNEQFRHVCAALGIELKEGE